MYISIFKDFLKIALLVRRLFYLTITVHLSITTSLYIPVPLSVIYSPTLSPVLTISILLIKLYLSTDLIFSFLFSLYLQILNSRDFSSISPSFDLFTCMSILYPTLMFTFSYLHFFTSILLLTFLALQFHQSYSIYSFHLT